MSKVIFKTYNQDQLSLLPPSYDDFIPANHPVRIVNSVIDNVDISSLEKSYKGGGTSSYHPRMLLKVLVYAYLRNIFSSRKIEEALHESVHFMWLSGQSTPDHNTINDFRGKRLNGGFKEIFNQVVILLVQEGLVSIKEVSLDGTKIEANANRYTFVWKKNVNRGIDRIKQQLKELWEYTEKLTAREMALPNEPDFEAIDPETVTRTIDTINQALKGKEVDKKVKKKLSYGKRVWSTNLAKYLEQKELLGERNSYSKTDPGATFMRSKDDHFQNGQLKPAYNIQASSHNQFIVNYTISQSPGDTVTMGEHLEEYKKSFGQNPETLTADAGYGSEENYTLLEKNDIKGFVKYGMFDKENSKKHREDAFHPDNLPYDEKNDRYHCPTGREMNLLEETERTSQRGFLQRIKRYRATGCGGCPVREQCFRGKGDRTIERNHNLLRLKNKARELLLSEEGVYRRRRRGPEIEAVFGNIKKNMGFTRFSLRGLDKVDTEMGLVAMAHNLIKYSKAV